MRLTHLIDISQIRMDKIPLNQGTYWLAIAMQKQGQLKPIKVCLIESGPHAGNFEIRDGRHRVTAARLLGWQKIMATYGVSKKRKLTVVPKY